MEHLFEGRQLLREASSKQAQLWAAAHQVEVRVRAQRLASREVLARTPLALQTAKKAIRSDSTASEKSPRSDAHAASVELHRLARLFAQFDNQHPFFSHKSKSAKRSNMNSHLTFIACDQLQTGDAGARNDDTHHARALESRALLQHKPVTAQSVK